MEDKKAEKAAEKAAKEEEVPAEESAAAKRKSGVTEAGKRMLDQTLDDIQEEVPPSQRNALFGLPESPTSPANAPAVESAGEG